MKLKRTLSMVVGNWLLFTLNCTPLCAFTIVSRGGNEVRWDNPNIHYQIQSQAIDQINTELFARSSQLVIRNAINQAFSSWSDVAHVGLNFVDDGFSQDTTSGNDGRNALIWYKKGWQKLGFGSQVLAVTITTFSRSDGIIKDADIHFNDQDYNWGVLDANHLADNETLVDVQNIATHEIGHMLGLDHSTEDPFDIDALLLNATMYYASYPGDIARRFLNQDDEAAAQHLYGTHTITEPVLDDVYPKHVSNTEIDLVVEISGHNFMASSMPRLFNPEYELDIVGKMIERDDEKLVAEFDLSGMPPGDYDVVVSNAYNRFAKLESALTVSGEPGSYQLPATSSGGGCGLIIMAPAQEQMAQKLFLCMITLMMLIHYRWRSAVALEHWRHRLLSPPTD